MQSEPQRMMVNFGNKNCWPYFGSNLSAAMQGAYLPNARKIGAVEKVTACYRHVTARPTGWVRLKCWIVLPWHRFTPIDRAVMTDFGA